MPISDTIEHILDVPYYRQIDTESPLSTYWQERSCGILALKMVIDYYRSQQNQSPLDLKELFDSALANGGVDQNKNWIHAALVKTASQYGLMAWRRNWNLSAAGQQHFTAEGQSAETLACINRQQQREALPTLVDQIESGHPVIISVAKNFDEVDKPHLVVLTGIKRKPEAGGYEGFYYNDPYTTSRTDRKDRYVDIDRFMDKWNYLAIFVEPSDAKV